MNCVADMWISTYLRRTTIEAVRVVLRRLVESCQSEIPVKHVEKFLDSPVSVSNQVRTETVFSIISKTTLQRYTNHQY